ncbi:hypothetical protein [Microbispora bryophytorum]|uniref:hypothetical protein n=1 Tax=Microbispora bryophytorum TaxID=1460882 RepID=UPI0037106579
MKPAGSSDLGLGLGDGRPSEPAHEPETYGAAKRGSRTAVPERDGPPRSQG